MVILETNAKYQRTRARLNPDPVIEALCNVAPNYTVLNGIEVPNIKTGDRMLLKAAVIEISYLGHSLAHAKCATVVPSIESAICKCVPRTIDSIAYSLSPVEIKADAVSDCLKGNALDVRLKQAVGRDRSSASHRIAYENCAAPGSENSSAEHLSYSQRWGDNGAAARAPNISVGKLTVNQGNLRAAVDLNPPRVVRFGRS